MKGISFHGCAFYDVTAAGGEWVQPPRGVGWDVRGCHMSGTSGSNFGFDIGGYTEADPENGGFGGVSMFGNYFDTPTAVISSGGTRSDGSNVRGIVAEATGWSMRGCIQMSCLQTMELASRTGSTAQVAPDETFSVYGLPCHRPV
jgi:hypothetical protein